MSRGLCRIYLWVRVSCPCPCPGAPIDPLPSGLREAGTVLSLCSDGRGGIGEGQAVAVPPLVSPRTRRPAPSRLGFLVDCCKHSGPSARGTDRSLSGGPSSAVGMAMRAGRTWVPETEHRERDIPRRQLFRGSHVGRIL